MWLTGLVAPWHVGSSQARARTRVPCIDRRILNHCATREAQEFAFLMDSQTMVMLLVQDHSLRTTFKQKEV